MSGVRSADVPTMDEFNALEARVAGLEDRVTALEEAQGVTPPDPPEPPEPIWPTDPRERVLERLRSIVGTAWVSAQMCHANLDEHNWNKSKGINCGLIMLDPCMDMQPASRWSDAGIDALVSHARSGGLVGVSLFIPNPVTLAGSTDKSHINAQEMITPGTVQYNLLIEQCDRLIATMKPIDDAGFPIFHRILWEAEGGWFWWGAEVFDPEQYQELFYIWASRVRSKLRHVIMCFATNGGSVDRYPAKAKPEFVGFDGYTDHPENYVDHYHDLMAVAPDALYNFAEFGSGDAASGNPNYDNQHFVDVMRDQMPSLCMAMAWSGAGGSGWSWGNYRNPEALDTDTVYQWGEAPPRAEA
jgi:Glycosyl hydrolase family 26